MKEFNTWRILIQEGRKYESLSSSQRYTFSSRTNPNVYNINASFVKHVAENFNGAPSAAFNSITNFQRKYRVSCPLQLIISWWRIKYALKIWHFCRCWLGAVFLALLNGWISICQCVPLLRIMTLSFFNYYLKHLINSVGYRLLQSMDASKQIKEQYGALNLYVF